MHEKLPHIRVKFWDESIHFRFKPINSILSFAENVVDFETWFERSYPIPYMQIYIHKDQWCIIPCRNNPAWAYYHKYET